MGEEKKRPIWLGCRAKRRQNPKDGDSNAASVGRDFVIKNVALDEGTRMKVLYRAIAHVISMPGAIVMISGVVAFADLDPHQASMHPSTYGRGISAR
jgi:hypothetical protein